jgi:hypothetical protein
MSNFRLLSAAVILAAAIATPAFAQQAVQEPGEQAFYQSLGVGSHNHPTMSAMASARRSYAHVRVKHVTPKTGTNAHK